ncbi:hypothetical protein [Pararhodobacter sp. SW119]|uniref:hypothetical protein n=1 Tax=Pararhodobacter sp. SW119 TaxID=2780075 RepID=UPI001ADF10DD|nr:hypothetical protein [Pararhodobacter sp. SW119]
MHIAKTLTPAPDRPRDGLYRLSQPFLDIVQSRGLGLQGLRLLHLIAHAICRQVPDWHRLTVDQPEAGDGQGCLVFRRHLGLERSNGNRALEDGIEELRVAQLFDWIGFVHDHHWLSWRLRNDLFERLFGTEPYGYFNIRDLAGFRAPLDLMVYGELGIVRAMRRPEVSLSLDGYAASLGRAPEWHRMRADVVHALQKSAARFQSGCVVLLECRGTRRGVDTATIRLRHQHSRWSWEALTAPMPNCTVRKILLVDQETCLEVNRKDAAAATQRFFTRTPE